MIGRQIDRWLDRSELRRGGICLECRFLVPEGEPCDLCGDAALVRWKHLGRPSDFLWHAAVAAHPRTSSTLIRWGSPRHTPATLALTALGSVVMVAGLFVSAPWAAIGFVPMAAARAAATRADGRRHLRGQPLAVPADIELGDEFPQLEGTIASGISSDGRAPVTAWQVVPDDAPGTVVLRHALVRELVVLLDDGRRVQVPAGRAQVLDLGRTPQRLAEQRFLQLMATVLRLEVAYAAVGARVRLQVELEPMPDRQAGYREMPGPTHRVIGVPTLRLA